ncbi:hypothetical protein PR048_018131 [Dryococelus australis]|uniref:Reverse transcriptase domain-containing protein n=1 Tax=Dryococelus australis TaxID=614101 RepID=A0ABQ9HBJ9_9NEOP|nr:hypothetical protein PR048_018131 [Dryococelus australis]
MSLVGSPSLGSSFVPLLGRSWLDALFPSWRQQWYKMIQLVSEREEVVTNCGSQTIQGFQASPVLKENCTPIFHKAYSVSYALKDEVGRQLKQLQFQNVIFSVKYCDWASPVVVVPCLLSLGHFRFKYLPHGVASAPAIFQAIMDQMISNMPMVTCYLDDLLIAGTDEEDSIKKVKEVLKKLNMYRVHLNVEKCQYLVTSVDNLGHTIFKPNISTILQPLYDLTKKNVPCEWPSSCQEVFAK